MALLVLTTETRDAILDYYGVADLVELSLFRPDARPDITDPGEIDWDAIARWATKAIAWFTQRGYTVDQTSDRIRDNVALFRPAARLSEAERAARELLSRDYPPVRGVTASGTTVAAGSEGDRRKFSDDQLDAIDNVAETRGAARNQGGSLEG